MSWKRQAVPRAKTAEIAQSSKATSVTRPSMTLDVNIPNLWPCKRGNYISCSKRRYRNIEWKLITKRCWCGGKGFLIESKILVNPAGGSLDHGASNLRDQHRNDRSSAPEQTFHKTFYGFQILRSDCVSIKHLWIPIQFWQCRPPAVFVFIISWCARAWNWIGDVQTLIRPTETWPGCSNETNSQRKQKCLFS